MDFSGGAGVAMPNSLIPNGQLAWAVLSVRGVKASQKGGQYIDIELTIDDNQPYARKKVWDKIGDPQHPGNSDAYKQMGFIALARILEAGRGASPTNTAAYQLNDYSALNGLRVPIKIGIEKGTGGYDDKNKVAEYLTPNPASQSGHKDFLLLQQGVFNKTAAAAPTGQANGFGGGFGGQQQQNVPTGGGFAHAGAPSAGGFGAQSATIGDATTGGFGQTTGSGFPQGGVAPSTTSTRTSPSETPNWLAQANGG